MKIEGKQLRAKGTRGATDAEGRPFEILARFGRAGGCGAAIFDGITKTVSYALRLGLDPADAVKAFSGILRSRGRHTCLNAVSEALGEVLALSNAGNKRISPPFFFEPYRPHPRSETLPVKTGNGLWPPPPLPPG